VSLDQQGNLYGLAWYGSTARNSLIYKLTPPARTGDWVESVLHDFVPKSINSGPGYVSIGSGGVLYEVVSGISNYVFSLSPSLTNPGLWIRTDMYRFPAKDSIDYLGSPLTVDSKGNIYGAMAAENSNANPVDDMVYMLTPPADTAGKWELKVLYSFLEAVRGSSPDDGLVVDAAGNVYGTTYAGGTGQGVFFKLSP
jgi:hypothetical protein